MKHLTFKVKTHEGNLRLDQFLALKMPDLSRRKIRLCIDRGGVYRNKKRARIASKTVQQNDIIEFIFTNESLKRVPLSEKFSLTLDNIIFENEQILIINKPPHLPSQATRDQAVEHVIPLLERLLKEKHPEKYSKKGPSLHLAHRLDKETSGLMVCAKSQASMEWLTEQFKSRSVMKTYHAICVGVPPQKSFSVECYLSAIDKKTGCVTKVRAGGKYSKTDFKLLQKSVTEHLSLLECRPLTGRSHQIRVHLKNERLPIFGDKRYGCDLEVLNKRLGNIEAPSHQLLHARSLCFSPTPGAAAQTFEAPYPPLFKQILQKIF